MFISRDLSPSPAELLSVPFSYSTHVLCPSLYVFVNIRRLSWYHPWNGNILSSDHILRVYVDQADLSEFFPISNFVYAYRMVSQQCARFASNQHSILRILIHTQHRIKSTNIPRPWSLMQSRKRLDVILQQKNNSAGALSSVACYAIGRDNRFISKIGSVASRSGATINILASQVSYKLVWRIVKELWMQKRSLALAGEDDAPSAHRQCGKILVWETSRIRRHRNWTSRRLILILSLLKGKD